MKMQIDETDARILDMIQRDFPLDTMPFYILGQRLTIGPDEVLSRIARMKSDGIIRQISAIFDSDKLGYHSALVAFKVIPELLDCVASEVSKHQGVSHCYSRNSDYDLWFTLTLPPEYDIQSEVAKLAALDGVLGHLFLPAVKVYKIGVILSMSGKQRAENRERTTESRAIPSPGGEGQGEGATLPNIYVVRALQTDLPLTERPFADIAYQAGISENSLLNTAHDFLRDGIMRRYAAVLRHGKAGYIFNAMVCWKVLPNMIDEVGEKLSRHPSVSHCYERPAYPDWPYNLYTMVHAQSQAELDRIICDLSSASINADHLVLKTLIEYKKTRVLYFQ